MRTIGVTLRQVENGWIVETLKIGGEIGFCKTEFFETTIEKAGELAAQVIHGNVKSLRDAEAKKLIKAVP